MLQPQTINRNSKGNDIQAYVAALYEIKYLTALNRAETSKASVQKMTIVMYYALVDKVRCFSGQ